MNISSLIGVISALVVFFTAIFTSTQSREVFLDSHGILIVIGGTAAASLICFPLKNLLTLFKVFFNKVLGKYSQNHSVVISEIVAIANGQADNPGFMEANIDSVKTHFLKEALELVIQGGMDDDEIDTILRKRALTHYKRHDEEASIFKTIGKFPPAFGLMGTTLGMISLLQKLGSPDAYKLLGPSMAIGLVATFYGIAVTNLILVPIGENLGKLNKEDEILREMVIDGIGLLRLKKHPLVVEEHLKSYLLPTERQALKKAA
jgi:chemotaxis protein MotA